MPIYEYACSCGNTFELMIFNRSDAEEVKCPACQGTDVKRQVGQTVAQGANMFRKERHFKKVR